MKPAIIVCGSPGAGKTTYGKQLAAELGAVFLDIDMSTERLIRLSLRQSGHDPDDRDSSYFKQVYREWLTDLHTYPLLVYLLFLHGGYLSFF